MSVSKTHSQEGKGSKYKTYHSAGVLNRTPKSEGPPTEILSTTVLLDVARCIASEYPVSDSIKSLLQNNDVMGLASFSFDHAYYSGHCVNEWHPNLAGPLQCPSGHSERIWTPRTETSWDQVMADRQICALFSKNQDIDLGVNKERAAWEKWLVAEERCRETNEILRTRAGQVAAPTHCLTPEFTRLIEHMRRYISRVLGPCPAIDDLHCTFGSGATTVVKKKNACPFNKMKAGIAVSEQLAYSLYLPSFLRSVPNWTAAMEDDDWLIRPDENGDEWLVNVVIVSIELAMLQFVPKQWNTDRAIVVEPNGNGFLQQGARRHMERRMALFGLTINDQGINRSRARSGSLTGDDATIDLVSASDMQATELIRAVTPPKWFSLLNSLRTRTVRYKKHIVEQEKFCSMGNAFTFPLETLIFAACCDFVTKDFSVYGDDIIVPSLCADDVCRALRLIGFEPNLKKSFSNGGFRESCGGDYLAGVNVRPTYVKSFGMFSAYTLYNSLIGVGGPSRCISRKAAQRVLKAIPREWRFYGPERLGDVVLHSENWKPVAINKDHQSQGIRTLGFRQRLSIGHWGDWVTPLYTVYNSSVDIPSNGVEFSKDGRPMWPVPSDEDSEVVSSVTYIS